MLWLVRALGTRTLLCIGQWCSGLEHEHYYALGIDGLVHLEHEQNYGLGMDGLVNRFEHERYHALGMDVLVMIVCFRNTYVIRSMLLEVQRRQAYALGTRALLHAKS